MTRETYELRDARTKLTAPSDQMLEAVSRLTGKDKSELIREIVHTWYEGKWREYQMIGRFLRGIEGVAPPSDEADPRDSPAD